MTRGFMIQLKKVILHSHIEKLEKKYVAIINWKKLEI